MSISSSQSYSVNQAALKSKSPSFKAKLDSTHGAKKLLKKDMIDFFCNSSPKKQGFIRQVINYFRFNKFNSFNKFYKNLEKGVQENTQDIKDTTFKLVRPKGSQLLNFTVITPEGKVLEKNKNGAPVTVPIFELAFNQDTGKFIKSFKDEPQVGPLLGHYKELMPAD